MAEDSRLPDFICVGPGRTGTTWLDDALRGHVCLPHKVKETSFWVLHYDRGIEWYAWHFRHRRPDLPAAEVCPYFPFEVARQRIAKHLPNCRIVITLRNPTERAYSAYKMLSRMALVRTPFEVAVETYPLLVEGSRYGYHLKGWIDLFGEDNVLITFHDDLKADRQRYLDDICNFVSIPRVNLESRDFDKRALNSYETRPRNLRLARKSRRLYYWLNSWRCYGTVKLLESLGMWHFIFDGGEPFPPIAPDTETRLREKFLPEVEMVEKITRRDLSAWKRPAPAHELMAE